MTEFAHITPTAYLDLFATGRSFHLTLAHLVEQDPKYAEYYKHLGEWSHMCMGSTNIMDNSAFEMYKEGRPMYSAEKLIPMAQACGADYVVMSDYPNELGQATIEAAYDMAPKLSEAKLGNFYVPQSKIGDLDDLIKGFEWAANEKDKDDNFLIDYVGVSILAVPNAYGVEKDNKLQRFLSRWKFMLELDKRDILNTLKDNGIKIHFLGMVDGPNEIELLRDYLWAIDTWDSSAAVWAGLSDKKFDTSPTGLVDGKIETPVDFSHNSATMDQLGMAMGNCRYIDNLLTEDNYD